MNAKSNNFTAHVEVSQVGRAAHVKILYPMHQVALITASVFLIVMYQGSPEVAAWLYTGALLAWYIRMSVKLFQESWQDFTLCSVETTLSICAAAWHGVVALYFDIPVAACIAFLTIATLGLYGRLCNEH
jgi:hypothetical protein